MAGIVELATLLSTLKPVLNPGEYVFCHTGDRALINRVEPLLLFKEQEGYTLILEKEQADEFGFGYQFIASWITLTVHSSLEAVGLTAAFSKALADQGISCNVVAAFYHDHIFVKKESEKKALDILRGLAPNAGLYQL
jgi:uncharacterized protein